jgi:hypothetical protein
VVDVTCYSPAAAGDDQDNGPIAYTLYRKLCAFKSEVRPTGGVAAIVQDASLSVPCFKTEEAA